MRVRRRQHPRTICAAGEESRAGGQAISWRSQCLPEALASHGDGGFGVVQRTGETAGDRWIEWWRGRVFVGARERVGGWCDALRLGGGPATRNLQMPSLADVCEWLRTALS